jgi:hypothetical protein
MPSPARKSSVQLFGCQFGGNTFDEIGTFASYLHALRWSAAGIKIGAYQLEPFHKALRLPSVRLVHRRHPATPLPMPGDRDGFAVFDGACRCHV